MNLLKAVLYDPGTAAVKSTATAIAMTAFDTTNLRLAITVPAHGMVLFKLRATITGATTVPTILLGVMNGATVLGRVSPADFPGTMNAATQSCPCQAEFVVTGLTPGAMNVDAAYGVEVVVASTNIKYGGPNDTTTNNAWGAFMFEAWDPQPLPTAVPGAAGGLFIAGSNAATTANITGNLTGNVSGSVGSVTGAVGSVTGNVGGNVVGSVASVTGTVGNLAAGAKTDVENAVWNTVLASHLTAGSTGNALNAAGAAGDPWTTSLPGAYGAGTAGFIVGTNLNAAITSRMATYTQPTGFLAATFPASVASPTNITAGTITTATNLTNLPSIPANWLTAAGINAGALNGKGDWLLASGYTAPPSVAAIATGVWQDATAGDFTVASSIGKCLYIANVIPGAAGGHFIAGTNAATTITGSLTTTFTGNLTGNVGGNVVGSVASVTAGVTVTTNNDKTGYSLTVTPPTAAQVATAVWQDLLAGTDFSTVASVGKLLKDDIDATVSSRSTYAGGDTAGTTTLLSRLTATRAGNLDNLDATVSSRLASASYTAPPTAAVNAAATWDLPTAGHTTGGTFGAAMSAAGAAGDPWSTSLPGAYGTGSAGFILGTNLDTKVTTARLAPTGLDAISVADPGGVANWTTLPRLVVALARRLTGLGKVVKDDTAGTLTAYADDGTTPNATQAFTVSATVETLNKAT